MRLRLTFILAFVALSLNAAITTNILSVGGYGTNDYVSLNLWEAGRNADLTTGGGKCEFVQCFTTNDNVNVDINGWTTAANTFVYIYTPASQRHSGKLVNSGGYILSGTFINREDFVVVEGIAFANATKVRVSYTANATSSIKFTECVSCLSGFESESANASPILFRNCIATNTGTGSINGFLNSGASLVTALNCTSAGSYVAFRSGAAATGTMTCTNCIAYRSAGATAGFLQSAGTIVTAYCASTDATADDYGSTGARINQTFTFVDAANGDYHLASNDAGARNYGVDLSATFTIDIDGATRPGESVWDIGADEYGFASSATKPTTTYLLKGLLR